MDDEELEKDGDTQTPADNTNASNADNANEQASNTDGEQKENAKDNDSEKDDEVANAFGNKSENKSEGDKGKKTNTVAKKNTDGSITFKNQEELDGFIDRMVAKGAKKAEEDTQSKANETTAQNTNANEQKQSENNENINTTQNFTADIALSMIEAGADSSKARRAARLVDISKVIVNGQLDEAKLKEEVESILSEFPEFKSSQSTENSDKGFKFGAGKQAYTDSNEDLISDIFGNKQ